MPDTNCNPAPRLAASADSLAAAAGPAYQISGDQIDQITLRMERIIGALVAAQIFLEGGDQHGSRPTLSVLGLAEEAMTQMRKDMASLFKVVVR